MSAYGPCNFKLIIGNTQETIDEDPKIQETFSPNVSLILKNLFKNNLINIKTKEEIYKYILEIIKIEDSLSLNEKYICSIMIAMNKYLLTKEIIENILEEEFHLTLLRWLIKEKTAIEESNSENPYKSNIYIGLLINIINLYDIFPIKAKDLCEYHFYNELFKLNKLIKLKVNNSFPFLQTLKILLKKWKKQIDCFNLSKTIQNICLLGKKTKLTKKDKKNKKDENDKKDTDADSEENRREKKVYFEESNKIFFYQKDKSPSNFLNQNKSYDPLNINGLPNY